MEALAILAGTCPVLGVLRMELIATVCGVCHSLDRNKVGPALGGVVGREAGSVAGYPCSAALARAHVVWDPTTPNAW